MLPGWQEMLPILIIGMVIFGAKKLPEIGSGLGKGLKNFKKSLKDTEKDAAIEDDKAVDDKDKKENS